LSPVIFLKLSREKRDAHAAAPEPCREAMPTFQADCGPNAKTKLLSYKKAELVRQSFHPNRK
jgi:hypothetical protein